MQGLIDVHTHLNMSDAPVDEVLQQAKDKGVERFITIGTCPEDLPQVLATAKAHAPEVYCTLGIHPHEASLWSSQVETFILENASDPAVVAIGEIGLDFYYDHSPREKQMDVFHKQMSLAQKLDMPVEIHTRDAEDETIEVLQAYKGLVRGIIHCFTGSQKLADAALDSGFNISISGVVTFKKAEELREVVRSTPLDRLHVETDSPFLAPVPKRGQKNTSANVVYVARKVAELKGITEEELVKATKENALKMFPKIQW